MEAQLLFLKKEKPRAPPERKKGGVNCQPPPERNKNTARMAGGEPGHPPERKKGEVGCQLPHRKKERTEGKGRARPPP